LKIRVQTITLSFPASELQRRSQKAILHTAELLGNLQIHRRIVVIILAAATLLVMVRFGFRLAAYLEYYKKVNGYAVVEVIEIDPTEKNEGGK